MKKLLFILLCISSLYSQSHFYFGGSMGAYHESFEEQSNVVENTTITSLKIGYGQRKAYAVEFSFDYIKNKSKVFSSSGKYDGNRYGFNLALVKSFDYDLFVLPFIKAGFGSGFMHIQRTTQKKISYGSYNLATGVFIPIYKKFDIELGYKYRYMSYQPIDTIAEKTRYKSHINILYSGINFRF